MASKVSKKLGKRLDKLTDQWNIIIPKDIVEEFVKQQLEKISSQVTLSGFRKGKAPISEVDKKYGEDAFYRSIREVIGKYVDEIKNEEKYNLLTSPSVGFTSEVKRGKDLSISVNFTKKPKIDDIKYEKFKFDVHELELDDEDKKEEIDRFRSRMAKHTLIKEQKAVENGDMVDLDFVGKTGDGVEFAGGSAKGYKLEIGSKTFVENFEEQIIGHKKGETFDVKVKFPEVYHSTELQGKNATFSTTINDVYSKELPELNDDFAKSLGFKNGIGEIKDILFQNLKNIYESQMKQLLETNVFETLLSKIKFDLPENLLETRVNEFTADEQKKAEEKKEKFDEKATKKKYEEMLRKNYSIQLLVDNIAEKNDISVSEDEVMNMVEQNAIRNGLNIKEEKEKVKKDDNLIAYMEQMIKRSKVFNFIYEKIDKNIIKLNKKGFEEFLNKERNKIANNKK